MITHEELLKSVQGRLSPHRFQHTLGVVEAATKLAPVFQVNPSSLISAAILHDAAKDLTQPEQLEMARKDTVTLTSDDLAAKGILHARAGAAMAANEFKISDPEIIDAIRYHSTGRAGFSKLGQALFAADYLDPYRKMPEILALMAITLENPRLGLLEILKAKVAWVLSKNAPLHPDSVAFYNTLIHAFD